jgi:hypothetical protein
MAALLEHIKPGRQKVFSHSESDIPEHFITFLDHESLNEEVGLIEVELEFFTESQESHADGQGDETSP